MDQVAGAAPTVVVLRNDLGETLTFARGSGGDYTITSPGSKFKAGKTAILVLNGTAGGTGIIEANRTADATIAVHSHLAATQVLTDDIITHATVLIYVFI